MTDGEFNKAAEKLGGAFVELYAKSCDTFPKAFVLTAMTGALAACATEAGATRDKVTAALNAAFDDIDEYAP